MRTVLALGDLTFDDEVVVSHRRPLPCTCCDPPALLDLNTGALTESPSRVAVGPNAYRPEHGGVGDRSYLQRLTARGERDES